MAKQVVTVTTAQKLSPDQVKVVRTQLEKKLGKDFQLVLEVKSKVVGGIKISVGDKEYDLTVAGKLAQLKTQLNTAEIITAIELSADQRKLIKAAIANKYGNLELIETIDPTVIGGAKLRVGSSEIDGTIKAKLDKLRMSLTDQL